MIIPLQEIQLHQVIYHMVHQCRQFQHGKSYKRCHQCHLARNKRFQSCLLGGNNHLPRYHHVLKVLLGFFARTCLWLVKMSWKDTPNISRLITVHVNSRPCQATRCSLIHSCLPCIHHTSTHLTWIQSSLVCLQEVCNPEECHQGHPRWTQWWWGHLIRWHTSIPNKPQATMQKCRIFKHS